MPELTEITDVPPKVETEARIEDDDDDNDSDTTIPELEDTGKHRKFGFTTNTTIRQFRPKLNPILIFCFSLYYITRCCRSRCRWSGVEGQTIAWREEGP